MRCFNCGDPRMVRGIRGRVCKGCGHTLVSKNPYITQNRELFIFGTDREEVTDPDINVKELESENILELTEEMRIKENIIFRCDNKKCSKIYSINKEKYPRASENLLSCPKCDNIITRNVNGL